MTADLQITPLFVGLLVALQIALTLIVGQARQKTDIRLGDGGDDALRRRIRAHGNFTESVPITLLAMAVCELGSAPGWLLWSGGLALTAGRVLHAVNLIALQTGPARDASMALTTLALVGFGGFALWLGRATLVGA